MQEGDGDIDSYPRLPEAATQACSCFEKTLYLPLLCLIFSEVTIWASLSVSNWNLLTPTYALLCAKTTFGRDLRRFFIGSSHSWTELFVFSPYISRVSCFLFGALGWEGLLFTRMMGFWQGGWRYQSFEFQQQRIQGYHRATATPSIS